MCGGRGMWETSAPETAIKKKFWKKRGRELINIKKILTMAIYKFGSF